MHATSVSQRSSESPFGTKITMGKCLSKHPALLLGIRASHQPLKPADRPKKEKGCDERPDVENIPSVQSVHSLTRNVLQRGIPLNYMPCQSSAPLVHLVHKSRVWHKHSIRPEKAFLLCSNIGNNTDIVQHKIPQTCQSAPDPIGEEFSRLPSSPANYMVTLLGTRHNTFCHLKPW